MIHATRGLSAGSPKNGQTAMIRPIRGLSAGSPFDTARASPCLSNGASVRCLLACVTILPPAVSSSIVSTWS